MVSEQHRSRASLWNQGLLVGSVVLPPLVVRIALLVDTSISVTASDGIGFISDAAVSLLLAVGIVWLARVAIRGHLIGTFLVGIWSLLNFANYENIRELGSVVTLSYAGYLVEAPFLRGSALAPTHPVLVAVTTVGVVGMAWFALAPGRRSGFRAVALTGLSLLAVTISIPRTDEVASWRQTDVLSSQVERLIHDRSTRPEQPSVILERLDRRDLAGTPLIATEPRARNVLLVILEGVSGAYLPSLRLQQHANSSVTMPELDQIARDGLAYATFIATQRQTNRGEYALLCGDYPKLVTGEAKMAELVGRGPLDCLPFALRRAGYDTVYLQAAPMAFMMKDQFMPQAGFDRVYGDASITHSYNRNHWGVDDRAFFEKSLKMVEDLDSREKPWFLTLLTVGTHHRYNVPPDFVGTSERGTAAWAFEYLDSAIGKFISQLASKGVLDSTLVLITSDESQAMEAGAPDDVNMLTQGWGLFIALVPSREQGVITDVFVQPDIPISVLDYLQIDPSASVFSGRSVFRAYDNARAVFWGNTYLGRVAGLSPDDRLTICSEDFRNCGSTPINSRTLFSPLGSLSPAHREDVEWLRDAAGKSLATVRRPLPQGRDIALIAPGRYPVANKSSERYLFGGQFITVPAHSRVDVDIVVTILGEAGWIDFTHNFLVARQPRLAWSNRIGVGETLRLRYTVGVTTSLQDVECRFWVTGSEGADLELDFEAARIRVEPLAPEGAVPETAPREYSILPATP